MHLISLDKSRSRLRQSWLRSIAFRTTWRGLPELPRKDWTHGEAPRAA